MCARDLVISEVNLILSQGICFQSNYSILHLSTPDTPSQPCLSCTKQWCLNQNLPICAGALIGDTNPDTATGKAGDVEARCFRTSPPCILLLLADCPERDSPRDQLVVTLFLLTVFGLLLGAGVKNRMLKAGLSAELSWSTSRRWWEVIILQLTVSHQFTDEEHTISLGYPINRRAFLGLDIAQTGM